MPDQNTIEKVYDIKTLGGSDTYQTLANINRMFEQIKANKTSLNGVFNINIDTSKLGVLDTTMVKLIDEIKVLTAGMKDLGTIGSKMAGDISAAMAKLNMATLPNIVGFKEFQATINPANVQGYAQAVSTLGARLAFLKNETKETTNTLNIVNDSYKKGKISEESYTETTARLTTELQMLKTQTTEVTGAMTTMNKLFNPALTEEETIALAENRVELQQRNQLLKLNAVLESAVANSRGEARAQAALYRKELDNINLSTEEGIARQKELIATIDELDAFIDANSEAYTRRKINIGNYPELTIQAQELKTKMDELTASGQTETQVFKELEVEALKVAAAMESVKSPTGGAGGVTTTSASAQLSKLKVDMQGLAVAGKEDTAEFKAMEIEAKRLQAAINEVNVSIKGATTTMDKFGNIVEKMGLRMIANLLIFQVAIELGTALWENITKLSDAEEIAKERLDDYNSSLKEYGKLVADLPSNIAAGISIDTANEELQLQILTDQTQSIEARTAAYKKLLEMMPGLFHGMTEEKALNLDSANSINEHAQAIITLQKNIEEITKARDAAAKLLAQELDSQTGTERTYSGTLNDPNPKKTANIKEHTEALSNYNAQLREMGGNLARINSPEIKEKKAAKEPHDYLNAELEAQKKLNDFLSKIRVANIQDEMAAQSEIFSNVNRSLAERLQAYAIYARDLKNVLDIQKQTEIRDVQDKLNKIAEIERSVADKKAGNSYNKNFFDKDGKLRTEEQTLLINKPALEAQLQYISTEYKGKLDNATRDIGKSIVSISKSSVDQMLAEIDRGVTEELTKITESLTDAKKQINDSHKPKERQDRLTGTLDLKNSVETDKVNLAANQDKIDDVQTALDIAHKAKDLAREKAFQDQLTDLKSQGAQLRAKLQDDEKTLSKDGLEDQDAIQREVITQSMSMIEKVANGYIQSLEQIDAYREEMAQRQLTWNSKMLNAEAQSGRQKSQNDKAAYAAEQALSKQKAEDQKKRAITQATINEGLAATQIIVNTLMSPTAKAMPDGGLTLALVQETASLAAFAAQIAFLSSAQTYALGGEVPSNGGMFGGRSHTAGGTPFVFHGGRFEAEAGELAIINKRSASSNQIMTVTGTPKQIASGINASGGGYNFAPGATMHRYEWGGSLGAQLQPPSFVSDYYTRKADEGYHATATRNDIMAIARAQQAHAEAVNNRIDNIQVSLNPHQVTNFQNNNLKSTKVGTL